MGNLKKMIFGEKMPDKSDPKYQEKYENDLKAGRRFARITRIDRLIGHIQCFADKHRKVFLAIVFSIIILCFSINIYHLTRTFQIKSERQSATQTQEEILMEKLQKSKVTDINTELQDENKRTNTED